MTEVLLSTGFFVVLVVVLSLAVLAARRVLLPSRPVAVTVNGREQITGQTGDTLLAILRDGGLAIPSPCGGRGTCGLCRVTVPDAAGAVLPAERTRLSAAEIADGLRLSCQLRVRGPLEVTVPDDYMSATPMACEVVSNRMLAPLIREVVLRVPGDAEFEPRPGSFVQVTAPPYELDFAALDVDPAYAEVWDAFGWRTLVSRVRDSTTRAYSLANRPEDRGLVVMNIRLAVPPPGAGPEVPPGIVSSYLFGLAPGETVEVSGPFGDFGAQETGREMVFIGGGVGMAPLRAIIHDQLERLGTERTMSFWYGARSGTDAFYLDEFRDLAGRHPNFRFTVAYSDPGPEDADGQTGFIHEVVLRDYLGDHPAPEDCEYYLCGPPLMIHAVLAMLDSLGVEEDAIFFDDFGT